MKLLAKNLWFSWGDHDVLRDVNFEIAEPGFLVVVGPNGAGKSTLIKLLLGRLSPTQGSLEIFGKPAKSCAASDIGYVPQVKTFDRSFPARVEEFVLSGRDSRWPFIVSKSDKAIAKTALKTMHSESLIGKNLSELSGGELQRVYLARSFIQDRKILILDEPAAGVDSIGEADLYGILENYLKQIQALVIMVTHDIEVARHHSSHVLILNQQQIAFGTPEEVLSRENLDRAFGHSQHSHD